MLHLAWFELVKLFGTRRGWLALAAFALVWLLLVLYALEPAARLLSETDPNSIGGLANLLLERIGWSSGNWSSVELALYWVIALYLFPLFALTMAADQTASDKMRGTLRYLLLRCNRMTLFFGRFLGQMVIQLFLILVTLASVLALVAWYAPENLAAALTDVPVLVVNLLLVLMPYVALMACMSVLAKSPRQAMLFAIIAWIVTSMLLGFLKAQFGDLPILDWVLPGSQVGSLMKLAGWDTLDLALVPLLHAVVLLGIGAVAMRRADL